MINSSSRIVNPCGIDEANYRIDDLKANITSIQEQLSRRKKPRKGSSAEDTQTFFAWRHKAVDALRWKQLELSTLKSWKRNHYRERGRQLCESVSAVGLLYKSYRINKRLLTLDGVLLTAEEQDTMDVVQAYLRSVELRGTVNDGSTGNTEAQEEQQ